MSTLRHADCVVHADSRYEVELGGVGESSKPSYYPADHPVWPNQPIYATQTAIFRLISKPARSPRSVRSAPLPFMPGSKESMHSHKRVGQFTHPVTAPGDGRRANQADVRHLVKKEMSARGKVEVGLNELWSITDIAVACAGSKRYLVSTLGGYGDCGPTEKPTGEFTVDKKAKVGLVVRWNDNAPRGKEDKVGA